MINYFFSGGMGRKGMEPERMVEALTCRLCSCHGNYIQDAYYWAKLLGKCDGHREMMLDSGAFTAWSKGDKVKVEHLLSVYGDIIEKHGADIDDIWLINLDVIPGSPGVTAGAEEIAQAIVESDENYEILRKEFGDVVLPVYHQGESIARLAELEQMTDYICISPRNDLGEKHRVSWAAEVHSKITTSRTHGLATTGEHMMLSANWCSVDSATWLYLGAMGGIACFNGKDLISPIPISMESPERHRHGKHYISMAQETKDLIHARADVHGIPVDLMEYDHMARKLFNGLEIVVWLEHLDKKPQKLLQEGLFDL